MDLHPAVGIENDHPVARDHGRMPDESGENQPPSARRELVLEALRASPQGRSIASLAEQLRIHPNTVRFHLGALQRTGQAEQSPGVTTGPGRPPTLFRATRKMDPAGPTNYRLLATILTDNLAAGPDPAHTAITLGRAWGPRLVGPPRPRHGRTRTSRADALDRVTEMLSALGFAPAVLSRPRNTMIRIRHCPFLGIVEDPASQNGEPGGPGNVICSLHLGVMQGALAAMDAPVTVERLSPFVEPDLCIAHVGSAEPRNGGGPTASRRTIGPRRRVRR
jgi:predicted ArsR family transcriptional regulator